MRLDISFPSVIDLISQMNLDEIEQLKKTIIEKELYFRKFQKDGIDNVMDDFRKENYSDGFLNDLEEGLRKSSIYNAD